MTPTPPIVVSFYTRDPHYTPFAAVMAASVVRAGLSLAVASIKADRPWVETCALKAGHVWDCLQKFPDRPVLWLDADAEIIGGADTSRLPWLLGDADLAVYAPGLRDAVHRFPLVNSNLLSGTMLWAPTERARRLASAWETNCHGTRRYDQEVLYDLVAGGAISGLKTAQLDPRYVYVPDLMPGVLDPVIVHKQASRTRPG